MMEKLVLPLLLVGYVLFAMFRTVVGVVLPGISSEFALNNVQAGVLVSSAMLSQAIATVIVGHLSGIAGRGKSLVLGYLLLTSGMILTSFAPNYSVCLLVFSVASFGAGVFAATLYAFVGEMVPGSRGLLLGVTNGVFALGGFVGPWLAGAILELHTWRDVFTPLGAAAVPILIGLFIMLRGHFLSIHYGTLTARSSYLNVLRNRSVVSVCLLMATANFAFVTFLSWTPTFLLEAQGLTISEAGQFVGIAFLFAAVGSVILGLLSDRIHHGSWTFGMIAGMSSGAFSLIIYRGSFSFGLLMILAAAFGFTCLAYWNLTIALAQESVGAQDIVLVTGLITYSGTVGGILGPLAAGVLTFAISLGDALTICVGVPFLIYGFAVLYKFRLS
jgi:MFS family permease